jgi:hypothetical protein
VFGIWIMQFGTIDLHLLKGKNQSRIRWHPRVLISSS